MSYRLRICALRAFVAVAFVSSQVASAQSPPDGSRIIRIDDGAGKGACIQQDDKITATIRGVVFEKTTAWLGLIEDKSINMTLTLTLAGSDSTSKQNNASFVKVVNEPLTNYRSGHIYFADEQPLINQFHLTDSNNNTFNQVGIEIGIVRTKGKSQAAQIISSAVQSTKSLNLPANPYSDAFGIATNYVNNIFEPVLQQAIADKEASTHHITMNINAANCSSDDEKTGTIAIIDQATNPDSPGYIDISGIDNNKYCFAAQLKPSFSIKFATAPTSGDCTKAINYQEIQNSYIGIIINATSSKPVSGSVTNVNSTIMPKPQDFHVDDFHLMSDVPKPLWFNSDKSNEDIARQLRVKSRAVQLYREAIERCEANGVPAKICI
ncbi:hypothetical protein GCM10009087_05860 [Sphingomonas oligophenolica]|uniref:Uncharacterized protein n=1 Tax=Sphingomonas oligophenolica TaxID=301154 RepID=A0ABU9XX11_9SPHN